MVLYLLLNQSSLLTQFLFHSSISSFGMRIEIKVFFIFAFQVYVLEKACRKKFAWFWGRRNARDLGLESISKSQAGIFVTFALLIISELSELLPNAIMLLCASLGERNLPFLNSYISPQKCFGIT